MSGPLDQIEQRVQTMLRANALDPEVTEGGLALRFASALVSIRFTRLGQQVVISLRAPVLTEVARPAGGETTILGELNRLNRETHFGKWTYYDDSATIALEYDLLGDHLQEEELLTALAAVARLADREDDALQHLLRTGRRAFER